MELTLFKVIGITLAGSLAASIVLPWALSNQATANEANAIATLRNLVIAQESYRSRRNPPDYARSLSSLSGMIDPEIAAGAYRGYSFIAGPADVNSFLYVCVPLDYGSSGRHSFYVDQTGIIRWSIDGFATALSPPLQ